MKWLNNLGLEFSYAIRSFFKEVWGAFRHRPYGIVTAILFFACLVVIGFSVHSLDMGRRPDHRESLLSITFAIGIAGMMYSVLSFHVALKVERSIREALTDFRQFLYVVDEIIAEMEQRHKSADNQTEAAPQVLDVILVLWFPYYSLTRDFNSIGPRVDIGLHRLRLLDCRTQIIAGSDPLNLMMTFDTHYDEKAKTYDASCLSEVSVKLQGQDLLNWSSLAREVVSRVSPPPSPRSPQIATVLRCIEALTTVLNDSPSRHYTVKQVSNADLMSGLVQLVWSAKRAALVFMPPVSRTPKATAMRPFECTGFDTQDPFMIKMIRDLVDLRFDLN